MTKQDGRFCPTCERNVLAVGTKPNHLLHAFLSVVSIGFWFPVWIIIALGKIGGYRCSKCGAKV